MFVTDKASGELSDKPTELTTTQKILTEAWDLLRMPGGWVNHGPSTSTEFCMQTAIEYAAYLVCENLLAKNHYVNIYSEASRARNVVLHIVQGRSYHSIPSFNDTRRFFAEVEEVMLEAILTAEAQLAKEPLQPPDGILMSNTKWTNCWKGNSTWSTAIDLGPTVATKYDSAVELGSMPLGAIPSQVLMAIHA